MQSLSCMQKKKLKEVCGLAWTECSDFNCSTDNGRVNKADLVLEQKHVDQ